MASLKFNFALCETSIHDFAETISESYEDAAYDGIYYDSVEVKSCNDPEKDKLLIEELKHTNPALCRCLHIVQQF